jgi:integral membrane protein
VKGALTRFRIIAWTVGVLLLALTLVAMPMKYFGHNNIGVAIVAPIHGWLFVVYLIATADLARRVQWTVSRILLVAVAGPVPFMSFIMERQVRTWIQLPEEVSTASAR